MKKVILSESELVSVIKHAINESETNEQLGKLIQAGIKKIGNIVSPEVKLGVKQSIKDLGVNAPQNIKQLMTKFGSVKNTSYIQNLLRPLDNELAIISNEIKKLQTLRSKTPQQQDFITYLKNDLDIIQRDMKSPKGGFVDFRSLYHEINNLKRHVENIIRNKSVSTQGNYVVKSLNQNIDDALKSIESALTQIATR